MDGTFLNQYRSYNSKRLNALLSHFVEREYLFVAASGRSLITLEKLFLGFEDRMAFIAENGSVVKLFGKIISEDVMSKELYLRITQILDVCPFLNTGHYLLSGEKGAYVKKGLPKDYLSHIRDYYENVQEVEDFSSITDVIFKLSANFTPETVLAGQDWVNQKIEGVTAVTTGFKSIDIILDHVNKRTGLGHLADHLGLSAKDVIAFGDNFNDKEMLEFAGLAIATDNAQPEIKALADQVIGHCKEESVMAYLEEMVK